MASTLMDVPSDQPPLQISDYFYLGEDQLQAFSQAFLAPEPPEEAAGGSQLAAPSDHGNGAAGMKLGGGGGARRVGFRCKTEDENLPDGYKWRKYGKKSVKNSPNKRNYYKCSVEGCAVKKRVERDGQDPTYVLTTYEGVHNHLCPSSRDVAPRRDYTRPFQLPPHIISSSSSSWQYC